jgi:hypothetical protein
MKIVPNKITLIIIISASWNMISAAPNPPAPQALPPPVGLPIDGGILVLALISIIFAFYKIYNIKKASN